LLHVTPPVYSHNALFTINRISKRNIQVCATPYNKCIHLCQKQRGCSWGCGLRLPATVSALFILHIQPPMWILLYAALFESQGNINVRFGKHNSGNF
jgi:hypothetical protein